MTDFVFEMQCTEDDIKRLRKQAREMRERGSWESADLVEESIRAKEKWLSSLSCMQANARKKVYS